MTQTMVTTATDTLLQPSNTLHATQNHFSCMRSKYEPHAAEIMRSLHFTRS